MADFRQPTSRTQKTANKLNGFDDRYHNSILAGYDLDSGDDTATHTTAPFSDITSELSSRAESSTHPTSLSAPSTKQKKSDYKQSGQPYTPKRKANVKFDDDKTTGLWEHFANEKDILKPQSYPQQVEPAHLKEPEAEGTKTAETSWFLSWCFQFAASFHSFRVYVDNHTGNALTRRISAIDSFIYAGIAILGFKFLFYLADGSIMALSVGLIATALDKPEASVYLLEQSGVLIRLATTSSFNHLKSFIIHWESDGDPGTWGKDSEEFDDAAPVDNASINDSPAIPGAYSTAVDMGLGG